MSADRACPRCGGPLDAEGRCPACEPSRPQKTVMVPIQPAGTGVTPAVPAGDDLGRVPLPPGWEITLDVIDGAAKGTVFPVTRSRVLIGRGEVDIPLDDPRVSRRHASLEVYGSACVLLKDLGSTNGTFVNGRRVTACEVQDGDEIRVGSTVFSVGLSTPP